MAKIRRYSLLMIGDGSRESAVAYSSLKIGGVLLNLRHIRQLLSLSTQAIAESFCKSLVAAAAAAIVFSFPLPLRNRRMAMRTESLFLQYATARMGNVKHLFEHLFRF